MFNPEAAAAVAGFFLSRAKGKSLTDLALMKLFFLTERTALAETTSLITGDNFVSMKFGPVLSNTYDLLRGKYTAKEGAIWREHFTYLPKDGDRSNTVRLDREIDPAEILSEYEIEVLARIWKEYGEADKWKLVKMTHDFKEWDKRAADLGTSIPMPVERIFKLGFGLEPEEAKARAMELEFFEAVA